MEAHHLEFFKSQMEASLRSLIKQALNDSKDMPEMMHGMMVMNAAGNFCKATKTDYSRLKQEIENLNRDFGLTEKEYIGIIDDVTSKVLDDFIERPNNPVDDDLFDF
ncbi:MAG: hypothetical protein PF487_13285 [Bacteroidales bacterium]|jgi:hypothetical protein|nr:hypothetical protein [Bacteroidales bacterium]